MKLPKITEYPAYFRVKVIPSAPRTELKNVMADDTLKIAIAAPPERGKANKELIRFLASELKVDASRIDIISGKTERLKLIRIVEDNN